MAELAALYTLGVGGFAAQKQYRDFQKAPTVSRSEYPVDIGPYNSRNFASSMEYVNRKNVANYEQAARPSNVIDRNKKALDNLHTGTVYSELSGKYFSPGEFGHNNMQPFFGSRVTQNVDAGASRAVLENFTGVSDLRMNKQEVVSMFNPTPNMTNVNGTQVTTDFMQSRMVAPKAQNNVLPVPQVRVGKGLGLSNDTPAAGGLHQFETQEYARSMYRPVDELRAANKPRTTYTAPVNTSGQRGSERASEPVVARNRDIARYRELACDGLVPNAAPVQRENQEGCYLLKGTHRSDGKAVADDTYFAPGLSSITAGVVPAQASRPPHRQEPPCQDGPVVNLRMPEQPGIMDDYGRDSVVVTSTNKQYLVNNERDGIITSWVKALVAPIQDMLRPTKAEYLVRNHRDNGPMQPQQPEKLQARPLDGARVTQKETLLQDGELSNLHGPAHGSLLPSDVTRVTRKETAIHDTREGVLEARIKAGVVYDPRAVARTTRKETVDAMPHALNMDAGVRKGQATTGGKARVTVKETTIETRYTAPVSGLDGRGAKTTVYEAKLTKRETTMAEDHYGAARDATQPGAYIAGIDPPNNTTKEIAADHEHFGAAVGEHKKQNLDGDFTQTNETRELIVQQGGRRFGPSGPKASPDATMVHLTKAIDRSVDDQTMHLERVHDAGPSLALTNFEDRSDVYVTSMDDRVFDSATLKQLSDNPFAMPALHQARH